MDLKGKIAVVGTGPMLGSVAKELAKRVPHVEVVDQGSITEMAKHLVDKSKEEVKMLAAIPHHDLLAALPRRFSNCEVLPIQPRNKVSRNALCPCGSGVKFKRCCKQ